MPQRYDFPFLFLLFFFFCFGSLFSNLFWNYLQVLPKCFCQSLFKKKKKKFRQFILINFQLLSLSTIFFYSKIVNNFFLNEHIEKKKINVCVYIYVCILNSIQFKPFDLSRVIVIFHTINLRNLREVTISTLLAHVRLVSLCFTFTQWRSHEFFQGRPS